ncbi:MAG: acyl carrier protein [Ruminococcaceae bacterium]|nr:acyl carrier protein [Oscillospiraceae bacterium]
MIERLKAIINRVDPSVATDGITEATRLKEDLKFDSLAMMMMSMEVELEFSFKFTEFVKFETVGDVCRYIESKGK